MGMSLSSNQTRSVRRRSTLHAFLRRLFWPRESGQQDKVVTLATTRGTTGGLIKRIDENRELLQLLQAECPTFLTEHRWVEGWIGANDDFFTQLASILDVSEPLSYRQPRAWPGSVSEPPLDELAALRLAVSLMGFEPRHLARCMTDEHDAALVTEILTAVTVDEARLCDRGAEVSAAVGKMMEGIACESRLRR